jgi:hypothetical protein
MTDRGDRGATVAHRTATLPRTRPEWRSTVAVCCGFSHTATPATLFAATRSLPEEKKGLWRHRGGIDAPRKERDTLMPINHLGSYEDYRGEAERWLREADSRDTIEAGRECLWTAQVYATLAQAAATADLASRGIEVYSQ